MKQLQEKWLITLLCGGLAGCGAVDFSGRSSTSGTGYTGKDRIDGNGADAEGKNPAGPVAPTAPEPGSKALGWNLACEGNTNVGPEAVDAAIDGGGQFTVQTGGTYSIKFNGRHCDGVTPKKDILFLFDGSASMSFNDPLTNGTCGRLDTMNAIIQSFGGTTGNRFAMLAFSSGNQSTVISSGKFHDTDQTLVASLEASNGNKPIAEVVCNSNRIGTNYNTGFAAAESLVTLGAAKDAGTIIFFVSDGQPLFGQTGEIAANRLKANGAVIATVMVAGDETVMRDRIASRDSSSNPLHIKVASVSQLTAAITQLAGKTIVPDILRYRPAKTELWNVVNLFPVAGTMDWEQQEIGFAADAYPDGIEVEYLYFMPDTTGRETLKGSLTFAP